MHILDHSASHRRRHGRPGTPGLQRSSLPETTAQCTRRGRRADTATPQLPRHAFLLALALSQSLSLSLCVYNSLSLPSSSRPPLSPSSLSSPPCPVLCPRLSHTANRAEGSTRRNDPAGRPQAVLASYLENDRRHPLEAIVGVGALLARLRRAAALPLSDLAATRPTTSRAVSRSRSRRSLQERHRRKPRARRQRLLREKGERRQGLDPTLSDRTSLGPKMDDNVRDKQK